MIIALGCSGGSDPSATPPETAVRETQDIYHHSIWGYWQGIIDPDAETVEMIPLRSTEFHLNALPFLEPPALLNLTLETLQFNGNIIEADIGLRHPFLGLTQFSGFDVCGIFIGNGTVSGYTDTGIVMPGDGDTRLLNPDGYSRWWNPSEFPINTGTMFGYNDGLLGTPDSIGNFTATLNGYKYYCDDLANPGDPMSAVTIAGRGLFTAGQKNVRHYTIEMGAGLVFNYAVDASWTFPQGDPPYTAPDDFPTAANRAEAWNVVVSETKNTLYNDGAGENGGDLHLSLDVYDWFDAGLFNVVRIESPGNFAMIETVVPDLVVTGHATYILEVDDASPAPESIPLLISVISNEANYEGYIPGTNTTAYFTYRADVSDEVPGPDLKNMPLRSDAEARDIAVTPEGDLLILYDDAQVWKYLASDGFQQTAASLLFTAVSVAWPGSPEVNCDYRIDVSINGNIIAAAQAGSPWPAQSFSPTGAQLGSSPGPGAGDSCPDVYTYPGSGQYTNNHMFLCPGNGGAQNNMYRHVVPSYWAQIYQTDGENAPTGYDKVKFTQVTGAEGVSGNQFWVIEDAPDYYASRWLHTGSTYGYHNFDNAWFGTGAQTEADDGWYNAKDLTWDSSGRFYVLDELSSGQGRIKLFESGSPGNALTANAAGDADTISEAPLRIEGGQWDSGAYGNLIFVLHGDAVPSKLSVFFPSDFGF